MSIKLQEDFNIFKGDKVIYRDTHGMLQQRIIEDVVEVCIREGDEFIAVTLEGDGGCYVDFSDIITLDQALDYFDLEIVENKLWRVIQSTKINRKEE